MGEYSRLNSMLSREEERLAKLKEQLVSLNENTADKESAEYKREEDELIELIADAHQNIGEIKGALLENAEIDGLDDPYEAFDYGDY